MAEAHLIDLKHRELTSSLLIKYLGALSYKFDKQITAQNEDPDKLRDYWHKTYESNHANDNTPTLFDNNVPEELIELVTEVSIDQTKFIEYITDDSVPSLDMCIQDIPIYEIVWFDKKNSCFYSITIMKQERRPINEKYDYYGWETKPIKVNFLDLTNKYKGLTKFICETWSYEHVITQIKSN
jgi:hypothetical protein